MIDLDNSILPTSWGSQGAYSPTLDLLFSPTGAVIGTPASVGHFHFVLSQLIDASVPIPSAANSRITGVLLMDVNNAWQASTNYALEQWVVPLNPNNTIPQLLNDLAFRCTAAGKTGTSQPTAFATALPGQSITDNGVTWQCFAPKQRLIVSLATATGRVTTSPVSPTDKFYYAEVGEVTQ